MESPIVKSFNFIQKHPNIVYSFFLIIAITAVIFFNAYYSLDKFQKNTDALLQSKAVLAEDIFSILISEDILDEREIIQKKVDRIKNKDSEIKEINILIPEEREENFRVISSSNKENIDGEINDTFIRMAFFNDEGIAFIGSDEGSRYWEVAKVIKNEAGERVAIISFELSLAEHDNFTNATIKRVYLVSVLSLLFVLLVISNHTRLFRYSLKAAKLEEIDRMKDDFISMASHELRSPLTAIRGYSELLTASESEEGMKLSKGERIRYLRNIDNSASRLNNLVNEILEVSKIEQNRLSIKISDIDLAKVLGEVISEVGINADQKGLSLEYDPASISHVSADSERVKQILINLLSNGIKYTPKGKIEVILKEDDEFVHVTVADTGMGISSENLEHLFSKFYRVKSGETEKIIGTGLGLWISRELARKMGGDITVESIKGVGSHFTLKLKKSQV